ncbi:hypothetical protein ABPG77_010919 [Micractinium sp. CCAP 211/92]
MPNPTAHRGSSGLMRTRTARASGLVPTAAAGFRRHALLGKSSSSSAGSSCSLSVSAGLAAPLLAAAVLSSAPAPPPALAPPTTAAAVWAAGLKGPLPASLCRRPPPFNNAQSWNKAPHRNFGRLASPGGPAPVLGLSV